MERLTTNDQLRAAKRDWALAQNAAEKLAIIDPIVDRLIEEAKREQKAALAINDGGGFLKLAERDRHIARARAFLDAIDIVRKGGKA